MFKKVVFVLLTIASTNISYAGTQPLDIMQVTEKIDALFVAEHYTQCILLIDAVISDFETALQDKSVKLKQQELVDVNRYLCELWLMRARCHTLMNSFDAALDDCEKALQKDKDCGSAYAIKGSILLQMCDKKEGIKYIKIAAQKGYKPAQDFVAQNKL
jgi:lipopolysaccharide biosynthesis regulator YciM